MPLPSSYWLIHFSDLHRTLLKSDRFLDKNPGNVSTKREKGIKNQKKYCKHSLISKRGLKIRKVSESNSKELINLIYLKG
jgi:hypothetical protein